MSSEPTLALALVIVIALGVSALVVMGLLRSLLFIGRPSELVAFARWPGRRLEGAALLLGGRRLRRPLVERAYRLDASCAVLRFSLEVAGDAAVRLEGVLAYKISDDPAVARQAVLRWLGRGREAIEAALRRSLEVTAERLSSAHGVEVLASDMLRASRQLEHMVRPALEALGLSCERLYLTRVDDGAGTIAALGRRHLEETLDEVEDLEAALGQDAGSPVPLIDAEEGGPSDSLIWAIPASIRASAPPEQCLERGAAFVVSGRPSRSGLGFTVVPGEAPPRLLPIIEFSDALDLQVCDISLDLKGVRMASLVEIDVRVQTTARIGDSGLELERAARRFLKKPHDEVELMAKELLEGCVRSVLSTMRPELLVADQAKVEQTLAREAKAFQTMGLSIGVFSIFWFSDGEGYVRALRRLEQLSPPQPLS